MTTLEIYKKEYDISVDLGFCKNKYEWVSDAVFNLTTYDDGLDELFVKKIIEVCEAILNRTNFEYIKDETNYINYILVCQLLNSKGWIDWGTSIRGAWFMKIPSSKPIISYRVCESKDPVYFSVDDLKTLIDFVKE